MQKEKKEILLLKNNEDAANETKFEKKKTLQDWIQSYPWKSVKSTMILTPNPYLVSFDWRQSISFHVAKEKCVLQFDF